MRPLLLAALLLLATAARPLQEGARSVPLVNAGFEESELAGWSAPPACTEAGFLASVSRDAPFEGASCGVIEYTRATPPEQFGNLIQSVPAEDLRGKRVRFRAAVRTEGEARAQLWLREDGDEGFSVLFDNMSDRPIRGRAWATHEIVADVDFKASTLVMGMMLFEGGKAFLDDVSVSVLGDWRALVAPPRALTERGLRNLTAFARLLGYVRHFHPSDQAAELDWNRVTIAGVAALEDAPDDAALARSLQDFFAPVAPTVQVFAGGAPPAAHPALAQPEDGKARLTRWRNVGFGQDQPGSIYSRRREVERLDDGKPEGDWTLPAAAYEAELVPGLACRVPTVLWRDADGTLPHGEAPADWCALPETFLASGDDRPSRMAAVMLAWNVFQHFYPYFDVTEVDWPRELERALASAASDADRRAFLATLRRMVAALRDGHGSVSHGSETSLGNPDVCWDWIEGELVVLAPSADGRLAPGDVVLKIDGVPTQTAFERAAALLSAATPQFLRHKSLAMLGRGNAEVTGALEVRSPAGTVRQVPVPRSSRRPAEPRPEKIAELEPSIWYVDLGRIQQADFERALPDLAQAEGIVFDLRGYPTIWTEPLAHLIDEPIECAQWLVPLALLPDRKATTFQKSSWKVAPAEPHFEAEVAFLTDGRAVSAAETYMGLVEHHGLAPIVGEPTAGTNGNVNPFTLPGGYRVSWTGMKVLKQDGARHHGVGIQPTEPCARTIAGIAAGRDEQLERALALVRER